MAEQKEQWKGFQSVDEVNVYISEGRAKWIEYYNAAEKKVIDKNNLGVLSEWDENVTYI